MRCPVCPSSELVMTMRSGIEVDVCPRCRGVWLDRGELDKIVTRSARPGPDEDDYDDEEYRRPARPGRGDDHSDRRRPWWLQILD